jgi:hypothetical protein
MRQKLTNNSDVWEYFGVKWEEEINFWGKMQSIWGELQSFYCLYIKLFTNILI